MDRAYELKNQHLVCQTYFLVRVGCQGHLYILNCQLLVEWFYILQIITVMVLVVCCNLRSVWLYPEIWFMLAIIYIAVLLVFTL